MRENNNISVIMSVVSSSEVFETENVTVGIIYADISPERERRHP